MSNNFWFVMGVICIVIIVCWVAGVFGNSPLDMAAFAQ